MDAGLPVMLGDLDQEDDTNASITLSAHETAPNVRVITLVDDAALARYHRAAGEMRFFHRVSYWAEA